MRFLLSVFLSVFLFSLPVFGQTEKPQTIIVPTGSLGNISEVRKKILEKTLESALDDHFAIVPKDLFEEAQEKAFEELDYEECTEEQCIMMIKEILQVENAFQVILMEEDGDTHISLTWNDLDQKRVEEDYCEGCKTKQLMGSLRSLVKKMIGIDNSKKVKSIEKIVKSDIKPVQVQKPTLVKVNKNIGNKKFENLKLNKVELDIFTLCPHGDKIWYESVTDKDCLSSDVKYIGQAQFSNYLTIPNQGKVKTLIPHGKGKILYGNNKLMFKGIWKDGKKFNVKYYSSASGAILGSYINGYYFKKEVK